MILPLDIQSNLRSKDAYHKSFIEYGYFNKCFPRGIKFTDIDGIVEMKRHYLILEKKNYVMPIPKGQAIMHQHMIDTGLFTILYYFGRTDDEGTPQPGEYRVLGPKGVCEDGEVVDVSTLQQIVKKWADQHL